MAICQCCDIWDWIHNLPPIPKWKSNSMSMPVCSSTSNQPSLNLSVAKSRDAPSFYFSILANFSLPISLWTSKPFTLNAKSSRKLIDEAIVPKLMTNLIEDVLKYGSSNKRLVYRIPKLDSIAKFKDIFNFVFLSLTFLVCIYEAPTDIRCACLTTLKDQLTCSQSRQASKQLMRHLGSNIEEQWVRSINVAFTNWIVELKEENCSLKTPSPLFSYALSTIGLWKVQLYCPVIAMDVVSSSSSSADPRLQFSLNYHQLEGVIQFYYKVTARERWIDVAMSIDNLRLDVVRLVNETLIRERGVGSSEKHFPSQISLQLTPIFQSDVISVSVGKSSENPVREIGTERTIETSIDLPTSVGIRVAAGESSTINLKPWKFEESVYGNTAILNWFLHDTMSGREVSSTKPSLLSLLHPKSWFKNRYSSAYRPFTRQGGIVFAKDGYGDGVCWKVDKNAMGRTMEWEVKGMVWLTYWPNRHRTLYNETRRLEFKDTIYITLV
ncbi:unnamed protein product [Rhodiola kirilowii]